MALMFFNALLYGIYFANIESYSSNHLTNVQLSFSKSSLSVEIGSHSGLDLTPSGPLENETTVSFTYKIGGSIYTHPSTQYIGLIDNVTIPANDTSAVDITVLGKQAGRVILGIQSKSSQIVGTNDTYAYVTVIKNNHLKILNSVIGWMYFVAWSVSFYPQVILNIQRRSVSGLNFDFLALNFVGFACYSFFNIGLYFIQVVQDEYTDSHPWGIIPVEVNDVVFALHALLLTTITIGQCFCFQRDGQRVSRVCMSILFLIGVATIVVVGLKIGEVMNFLNLLYYFSYVKLGITIIKYIPQAWFNFRRKSTVGWSIGNILLDFTGGSLSIIQMFILAYNNDDWGSLFGNPTKFGLGAFSVLFDVLFMVQHYCLYRERNSYERIREIKPDDPEIKGDAMASSASRTN